MIVVYFPFPPTVNSYYQSIAHHRGIRRISPAGRQFRIAVELAISEQGKLAYPLANRLNVEVIIYPPDKRTRDLDNYMKSLLDACTAGGLWVDDSQIDQLAIIRGEIVPKGLVRLEVNDAGPIVPLSYGR